MRPNPARIRRSPRATRRRRVTSCGALHHRAARRGRSCWTPRWARSAGNAGRARTGWPRPSARRSPPASTWPCRPAPAPGSRWPTWCRPSTTRWPPAHRGHLHGDHRTAAPARRPRPSQAREGPETAARPDPDVRHPQGPAQLPVPEQAAGPDDVDPADELFDPFQISAMGRAVKRLHEWAENSETGDRDELVPGVPDATWRQVSVTARECLGAARCRSATTASPRRPGPPPGGPTWSSPTTRCWPSTPSKGGRCCPSTTWWWSTRRTSWWTG